MTLDPKDYAPEFLGRTATFTPDSELTPQEIIDGKVETSEWLKSLGLDDDAIATQAEQKRARESFTALTAPLDTEVQKKTLSEVNSPAAVRHLVGMLTAYDWAFVEQAKEIRGYCVTQLLEESKHPDAKVRLRAVELLGKVTEVGLFTQKVEVVTKHEFSDVEIEKKLADKMREYMDMMKVVNAAPPEHPALEEELKQILEDVEDAVPVDPPPPTDAQPEAST